MVKVQDQVWSNIWDRIDKQVLTTIKYKQWDKAI